MTDNLCREAFFVILICPQFLWVAFYASSLARVTEIQEVHLNLDVNSNSLHIFDDSVRPRRVGFTVITYHSESFDQNKGGNLVDVRLVLGREQKYHSKT